MSLSSTLPDGHVCIKHREDVINSQQIRRWRFPHNCLITAPSEFFCTLSQTGTYRIEHNIADQHQQVSILVHKNGLVSTLHNLAYPSVAPIESLGVNTVDFAHAL